MYIKVRKLYYMGYSAVWPNKENMYFIRMPLEKYSSNVTDGEEVRHYADVGTRLCIGRT